MPDFLTNTIYFAPLQGYTDYIYRSTFQKYFTGVDKFFLPYVKYENNGKLKASYIRDTSFENNTPEISVPQILCKTGNDLIQLSAYFKEENYKEANWNLGCPYPMVAKRKMGSGLLQFPDDIHRALSLYFSSPPLPLSIKMRLGYEKTDEFYPVLEVLNDFPLEEIIIHPRIGKQLYKGETLPAYFREALNLSKHKLVYNGDLKSIIDLELFSKCFPAVNTWMIGRGFLSNPFLAKEFKLGKDLDYCDKTETLQLFLNDLLQKYMNRLSGQSHILTKMTQHWFYLSFLFENQKKVFKTIKKSRSIDSYSNSVSEIFAGRYGGLKESERDIFLTPPLY